MKAFPKTDREQRDARYSRTVMIRRLADKEAKYRAERAKRDAERESEISRYLGIDKVR